MLRWTAGAEYGHFHFVPFYGNGYLFVDFFFVLSGFVISANYQDRLLRGFGIGHFMLLRFGRLYPLHVFTLACFILVEVIHSAISLAHPTSPSDPLTDEAKSVAAIAANILMVHSFHLFDTLTWNRPSWSIGTEFYTYCLFALMLAWFRMRGWLIIVVVMVVSPVLIASMSTHHMDTSYDYGLIPCIYGFSAGILAFKIYDVWRRKPRALAGRLATTSAEVSSSIIMLAFVSLAGTNYFSCRALHIPDRGRRLFDRVTVESGDEVAATGGARYAFVLDLYGPLFCTVPTIRYRTAHRDVVG